MAASDSNLSIQLNGAPRQITHGSTVQDLVTDLELSAGRFAVEVNQQIVPKSQLAQHMLQTGDRVEIIGFVGGG
ncbi:MAG: sulfur carrier protein ThiS [Planctomycetota bacterium]|nr:sulfur carrier protein ThiS [Planctomycetota bacterium]